MSLSSSSKYIYKQFALNSVGLKYGQVMVCIVFPSLGVLGTTSRGSLLPPSYDTDQNSHPDVHIQLISQLIVSSDLHIEQWTVYGEWVKREDRCS